MTSAPDTRGVSKNREPDTRPPIHAAAFRTAAAPVQTENRAEKKIGHAGWNLEGRDVTTRKRKLSAVPAAPEPEPVSLDAPPSDLSDAAKAFWRQVVDEFELERHHVITLNEALHSWDRAQLARIIVNREGMTVRDRFAQVRPHPMLQVERDARGQYARLMREVDLDGAAEPDVRPPRAPRNR